MNVVDFLFDERIAVDYFGVVPILPYFVCLVSFQMGTGLLEKFKHPLPPVFRFVDDVLQNHHRGKRLEITDDIR